MTIDQERTYILQHPIQGTDKFLVSEQSEEWPECYKDECPHYNPTGLCNKVIMEEE